jgi:hypothetical protein
MQAIMGTLKRKGRPMTRWCLLLLFLSFPAFAQEPVVERHGRSAFAQAEPGQVPFIGLYNPPGSGIICTIEDIMMSGTVQGLTAGITLSVLPDHFPWDEHGFSMEDPQACDAPTDPLCEPRTGCQLRFEGAPESTHILGQMINFQFTGLPTLWPNYRMTIHPGQTFMFRSGSPGAMLRVSMTWAELPQ